MGISSTPSDAVIVTCNIEHVKGNFENKGVKSIIGNLSKLKIFYLNAESRLQLCTTKQSHAAGEQAPQNLLNALYDDQTDSEDKINRVFEDTFGMQIRFDFSSGKNMCFRISDKFEDIPENSKKACHIMKKFKKIDDQGDGYKSFLGVILGILMARDRVVLIDEPEAFLHPAQAKKLGEWISENVNDIKGQLIISTHSANFLMGMLNNNTNNNLSVFRINRPEEKVSEFTCIKPESLTALSTSPVLSSQRVVDSLFHKGVVVCEGDKDRVFYQTVASKLDINYDLQFIHAHNKQTIPTVCKLLKDVKVPVCTIVDIDILNNSDNPKFGS